MKKALLILVLCVFALGLTGCQSAKGASTGVALAAQGAAEDTGGLWGALKKLDQWIQKNIW